MRATRFLVVAVVLLVVGIGGLVLLGSGVVGPAPSGNTPAARGQWIFQTGTDPTSRQPIPRSGGAGGMMGGGMMMATGCAACHGPDGRGQATPMFTAPNITYANLIDSHGMLEPDGSRGPTYTDAQIQRATTQGVDAEGQALAWPMPHWQLSDQEMTDLLAYLKTLH